MSLITLSSAVLSISLSTWAVLHIYTRLFADNTTPPSLSSYLLFAALAGLLTILCLSQVNRYLFLRRAKQLGCGAAPLYPHKDPILGLDTFKEALRALESHQLLELYRKRFQKCGSTHYNLVLGSWTLMTEDPENIKTILGKGMDDWPIDGPRLFAALPVLGPNSIFTSNGKTWHAARTMLRPSFSRNTREAASAELECFRKHVARMISAVPADGTTAFDMQDLLLDMTMDSSTDFLLGRSTNMLGGRQQREKGSEEDMASPAARRFVEDFEYASRESARMARLGPILLSLPHPRLTKAVQRLREYVRGYVAQAREEVSLGVIEEEEEELGLSTTDGGDEGSPRRSTRKKRGVLLDELLRDHAPDDYVTDQIMSILIAGRDTTATALTAVFYFLARAPEVVDKLRAEILAVEEDEPTREQLKQMKYLNNVIREGTKLLPLPSHLKAKLYAR
jgi:cytochrome P450